MHFFRLALLPIYCLIGSLVLAACDGEPASEPEPVPEPSLQPLGELLLANEEDLLAESADLADVRLRWKLSEEVDLEPLVSRVETQFEAWQAIPVPGDPQAQPEWLLHLPASQFPALHDWFKQAAEETGVLLIRGAPADGSDSVFVRIQLLQTGNNQP